MKTLIAQAFAKLPEAPEESSWIAYAVLIASGFAGGFLAGLTYRRWTYLNGFSDGIRAYLAPPKKQDESQPGDISYPCMPTIKISPHISQLRPPFVVSKEGETANLYGYGEAKTEIK